jgi:prepilin-type N-terminal cleavage/methylation domain-containing protein
MKGEFTMINALLKRRMENKKNNKKGFTLVELIVVLVIIAILAAVLVPTMSGYISRARKTAAQSAVKTEVTAYSAAITDAIGEGKTLSGTANKIYDAAGADDFSTAVESYVTTYGGTVVGVTTGDPQVIAYKVSPDGALLGLVAKSGNYYVVYDGSTYSVDKTAKTKTALGS